MRRLSAMAVMLVAALALPGVAEPGGTSQGSPQSVWKVKLTFADGKEMEGMMGFQDVQVQAEIGTYTIKAEKIKELQFEMPEKTPMPETLETPEAPAAPYGPPGFTRKGKLIPREGPGVEGTIVVRNALPIAIATDLGDLHPNLDKVKSITFLEKAPN